jgi:3-oxoacyl-[acyl-carrier protein] reductase
MKLTGKVAIVTGGAGGIGGATIQFLANEGAKVVISDINGEEAKKLEESLSKNGVSALAVKTDIGSYQQVKELTQKALAVFGRIDILVNNAGMPSAKKEGKKINLWETSVEIWERLIDVDLNGYFYCCREIVPHMIPNGWGRIVNVSSQAARTGGQSAGADYTTAKAGVIGMTKSLAAEVGKYGITVNAVAPGRIDTPIIRIVPPEVNAEFVKKTPLGRLGTAEDVAGTIMFLISDAASFITGATIDVNGGLSMY